MNKAPLLLLAALLISTTFISSCKSPTDSDSGITIEIAGRVLDNVTRNPLDNVIVRIVNPQPERYVISDSLGNYRFDLRVDSLITVQIEYLLEGYVVATRNLLAVPDRDIEVPDVNLVRTGSDDGTSPLPDGETTGRGASFEFLSVSEPVLDVLETGGIEQAKINFVIRDSLGRPIDINNQLAVTFMLGASPGGGVGIFPNTALTNAQGLVSTTVTSGTVSGVVQVIAQATRPDGIILRSRPVSITIRSGLPNEDHFSVAPSIFNFPGYNVFGLQMTVTAYVGDRYGNIVAPNTPVYFTTDGGIIEGSTSTDNLGRAPVTLVSALPQPSHATLGAGFATVRARTADENNNTIENTTVVLFSGFPVISTATNSINIPHQGSQTITYSVSDQNGNPLASGQTITVVVEGDNMKVIGDVAVTMADIQSTGPGSTQFQFTISDDDLEVEVAEQVQVTISTAGPNGSAKLTIMGVTNKAIPGN